MSENWCISVTAEQKQKIIQLFRENSWEVQEVDSLEIDASKISAPGYVIEKKEENQECPYCFCKPCVTDETNRQLWWETENHTPNQENNKLRKNAYKRFWTMLYHRQAWNDERYISKKAAALGHGDNVDLVWISNPALLHKRDIMPKCVVTSVRNWYPKTADQDYMDHQWD